jgi:hypothetical protein
MDAAQGDGAVSGGELGSPNTEGYGDARLRLLNDQPIRTASDDLLGFDAVAGALDVLILDVAEPPFTIAVNGQWGAGKTSVARLLQERLTKAPRSGRPHLVCWFDAWSQADAPDVTAALAAAVAREAYHGQGRVWRILSPLPVGLRDPKDRRRRVWWLVGAVAFVVALVIAAAMLWVGDGSVKDTAVQLGLTALAGAGALKVVTEGISPFSAAVSGYVKDAEKAAATGAVSQVRDDLAKVARRATHRLAEPARRLVVVIDDLDRCPPSVAVAVCTAFSQLLALPNVVVVLLGDIERIAEAAGEQFDTTGKKEVQQVVGQRYLDKVVQYEINLPTPTSDMLVELVAKERFALRSLDSNIATAYDRGAKTTATLFAKLKLLPRSETVSFGIFVFLIVALTISALWMTYSLFASPYRSSAVVIPCALLAAALLVYRKARSDVVLAIDKKSLELRDHLREEVDRELNHGSSPSEVAMYVYNHLPDKARVLWARSDIEQLALLANATRVVKGVVGIGSKTTSPDSPDPSSLAEVGAALAPVLPVNARQRKRVANHIILYLLIAERRGILRPVGPVPIAHVAKWAVLAAQWPAYFRQFLACPELLVQTEDDARAVDEPTSNDLAALLRTEPPFRSCVECLVSMTAPGDGASGQHADANGASPRGLRPELTTEPRPGF